MIAFAPALSAQQPPLPPNDDPCNAADLGFLDFPPPCPFTPQLPDTFFVDNNSSASYTSPYNTFPGNCGGLAGAKDLWYKFKASSEKLELKVNALSGLANPTAALYQPLGGCASLLPLDCGQGTGNLVKIFESLNIGQEYYLQIGGGSLVDAGAYSVSLTSYDVCDECVRNTYFDLYPPPVNGGYAPGTTVYMCFSVVGYTNQNGNRLHGIYPTFGSGWDLSTLVPIDTPATSDGLGNWIWTSVNSNNGFYYDADVDGLVTDNLGDQNTTYGTTWTGCWSIQTSTNCVATQPLNVNIFTTTDHETGSNPNPGCEGDTAFGFYPWPNCCSPPQVSAFPVSCSGFATDGYALVNVPATPYDIYVYDVDGNLVNTSANLQSTSYTIPSLGEGMYQVYIYNINSACWSTAAFEVGGSLDAIVYQSEFGCENNPGSGVAIAEILGTNTAIYTYTWLDGSQGLVAQHTNGLSDTLGGLEDGYCYFLKITDANGCFVYADPQPFCIDLQPPDDVTFSYPNDTVCINAGTLMAVSAPPADSSATFAFQQVPNGSAASINAFDGTFAPDVNGLYVIQAETFGPPSACPGMALDSVYVAFIPPTPIANSPASVQICEGQSGTPPTFQLAFNLNYTPGWFDIANPFTPLAVGFSFTPPPNLPAGTYSYFALNFLGSALYCPSAPATFTYTVVSEPAIDAGNDIRICPGDTAFLSANVPGGTSILWQPGTALSDSAIYNPTSRPAQSMIYYLFVQDQNPPNCISADSVRVIIDESLDCFLQTYHGFTPNGDGKNDAWVIDGIAADDNKVTIYNRWGDIIWEKNGYDNQNVVWRGEHFNGSLLPDGTYYFVINSQGRMKNGWIELTR